MSDVALAVTPELPLFAPPPGLVSTPAVQSGGGVLFSNYTQLPKVPGVYEIVHARTGKRYIGSARSYKRKDGRSDGIVARLCQHLSALRNNKHHNKKLQRSFKKYGEGAFCCSILFIACDIPACLECAENYFIAKFDAVKNGFNICEKANQPWSFKRSELTKQKSRESNLKFWNSQEGISIRDRLSNRFRGIIRGKRTKEAQDKRTKTIKSQWDNGERTTVFSLPLEERHWNDRRIDAIRNSLRNPIVLLKRKMQLESASHKKQLDHWDVKFPGVGYYGIANMIVEMKNAGMRFSKIAFELGIENRSTVNRIFKRENPA